MACNPREAALALHRFGFGPRVGSIDAIAEDHRGALLAELEQPNIGQIAKAGFDLTWPFGTGGRLEARVPAPPRYEGRRFPSVLRATAIRLTKASLLSPATD